MEHNKLKFIKGYLLVFSAIIIVIAALIATLILTMTSGGIKSTENVIQSDSALYLATSGLEITKREIIVKNKKCKHINENTNNSISGIDGKYTVNCYAHQVNNYLNSSISSSTQTIPLNNITISNSNKLAAPLSSTETNQIILQNPSDANALPIHSGIVKIGNEYIGYTQRSGTTLSNLRRGIENTTPSSYGSGTTVTLEFLKNGIIKIEDEVIRYRGISGNNLLNAERGIMGTSAASHSNNEPVYQKKYLLYSEAGMPNFNNPTGQRLVKEIISVNTFAANDLNQVFSFNDYKPAVVSLSRIDLKDDTHIRNMAVPNQTSPDFPGSTILTRSNKVNFKKYAYTEIASGIASNYQDTKADVKKNYTAINSNNLFGYYFVNDLQTIRNSAEVFISPNNLSQLNNPSNSGKTVIVTDDIKLNGDQTVTTGTQAQPETVVVNGNIKITGDNNDLTFGAPDKPIVLIVDGDIEITGAQNNDLEIYGLAYIKGGFKATGTCSRDDNNGGECVPNKVLIEGSLTTTGKINLKNEVTVNLVPGYINRLRLINKHLIYNYHNIPYGTKEIFQ